MNILVYVAVVAAVCVIWNLTIRAGLKTVGCIRYFSRTRVFEGETGEMIEVLHNDRPILIPWLRVESYVSPYLQLGRQENLHVSENAFYCSLFTLMPYQQIQRTHFVRFLHRGCYDLGNASLTAGDLLGLAKFHRSQELSAPVLVYPKLLDENQFPTPLSHLLENLVQRQQLQQDPFSIRGIRPYSPGDPVRDIHWAATARTGEAQLKIHDYSARTRMLVVLNVQYDDLQLGDVIPDQYLDSVEHGISVAATAAVRALRNGFSAGLAANMPSAGSKEITLLPPDSAADEEDLLSAFAKLEVSCAEKFPVFLERLQQFTGLDILVLSLYDSESIQTSLQELRARGNQVTLHVLSGGTQ